MFRNAAAIIRAADCCIPDRVTLRVLREAQDLAGTDQCDVDSCQGICFWDAVRVCVGRYGFGDGRPVFRTADSGREQ